YLNCRVMGVDQEQVVTSLEINRGNRQNQCVFMDTYIMKKSLFIDLVQRAAKYSSTYSLAQFLSVLINREELDIRGVQHKGFFASIDDLQSYYESNLSLLDPKNARDLFTDGWWIYTRTTDSNPSRIYDTSTVKDSMIANGCQVEGTVVHSVIGRGVHIGKGAVVRNSVILDYAQIGDGVTIDSQIVDKYAKVIRTKELISTPEHPSYVHRADTL
ncbi:MAG TPA: glucose-1-phosphate adenylyltransferase subunit GlgD, partial [Lachnospiraceae bacterium]|nr:glucose-1-phosphate adenylyltransferase subunit GlgD [Lachnospiraceae bacterium]